MAAFDFPDSPALNDLYTASGVTYQWNGYAWVPYVQTEVLGFLSWPAGISLDWWAAALPSGTRWCDGAQYDPALYPALFAAISTTFNTGGETAGFFRVPDVRGRVAIGKDNMGGTAALRMTTGGGHGINGTVLGGKGGAETYTLAIADLPAHTHTYSLPGVVTLTTPGNSVNAGGFTTPATGSAGSGSAHPNVQPGIVCNKLIITGGVA